MINNMRKLLIHLIIENNERVRKREKEKERKKKKRKRERININGLRAMKKKSLGN